MEGMIGNLFIQVPDTVQDLEDFGKGLENYFKTSEDFIRALREAFSNTEAILSGRIVVKDKERKYKDTSTFYTMPCEFFDQQSQPFTPKRLAKQLIECGSQKPFMLVFKFDDKHKESYEFNSEIRSWYKEHFELRKELPDDRRALVHEPKRLVLLKFKDEATGETYSFVVNNAIMYQKVHTSIYALIIFNAEKKKF